MKWLAILFVAGNLWACQGLFTPAGCTQTVFVTDSIKVFQGTDTAAHVDTLARFKLCAQ